MFLSDDDEPTLLVDELFHGEPENVDYIDLDGSSPIRDQHPARVNGINGISTTNGIISHGLATPPTPNVTIDIKEEQVDGPAWIKGKAPPGRVKIYVGRRNKQVLAKREDLAKSAILTSFIIDDPVQGAFIMRPQLLRTDFNDFDAVLQFIHSGEYAPILVEDSENIGGPKLLDGLKTHEAYAKEVVRSGRIYVIAQTFQVEGLAEQVLTKITGVDITKFNNHSLVELAGIVFSNTRCPVSTMNATGNIDGEENASAAKKSDPLEEWIICQLAKNFREIMRSEQTTFWNVEHKTSKKFLFARVLKEVADQYWAVGGLPTASFIELD